MHVERCAAECYALNGRKRMGSKIGRFLHSLLHSQFRRSDLSFFYNAISQSICDLISPELCSCGFESRRPHQISPIYPILFAPGPACGIGMGDTAENLARRYQITRPEVDAYAARSFARAMKAQNSGFLAGEITPVVSERFAVDGLKDRGIRIKDVISADSHIRTSTEEQLAKIKPAFGGVQTGGNSSAIVDGAAAILVGSARYADPDARFSGNSDGQTVIRQGNTTIHFGQGQSFEQKYSTDHLFNPNGRPGDDR